MTFACDAALKISQARCGTLFFNDQVKVAVLPVQHGVVVSRGFSVDTVLNVVTSHRAYVLCGTGTCDTQRFRGIDSGRRQQESP